MREGIRGELRPKPGDGGAEQGLNMPERGKQKFVLLKGYRGEESQKLGPLQRRKEAFPHPLGMWGVSSKVAV